MSDVYKRVVGVGGWGAEGGLYLKGNKNRDNSKDRQRWSLVVVWHYIHPY